MTCQVECAGFSAFSGLALPASAWHDCVYSDVMACHEGEAVVNRTGKPVQVYIDDERRERLQALADSLRRSLSAEILHAIDRHLDAPPALTVPSYKPGAPAAEGAPEPEKKPRGRPKKDG